MRFLQGFFCDLLDANVIIETNDVILPLCVKEALQSFLLMAKLNGSGVLSDATSPDP